MDSSIILLILGAALFCIGVMGALTLRNAIRILMCIELMLNGANITLIAAASSMSETSGIGQSMVVFVIAVAAAETVIGLGAIVAMYRAKGWVTLEKFNLMKW